MKSDYEVDVETLFQNVSIESILASSLTSLYYTGLLGDGQRRLLSFIANFRNLNRDTPRFRAGLKKIRPGDLVGLAITAKPLLAVKR